MIESKRRESVQEHVRLQHFMQGGLLKDEGFLSVWRKGSPSNIRINIIVSSSAFVRACLGSVEQANDDASSCKNNE